MNKSLTAAEREHIVRFINSLGTAEARAGSKESAVEIQAEFDRESLSFAVRVLMEMAVPSGRGRPQAPGILDSSDGYLIVAEHLNGGAYADAVAKIKSLRNISERQAERLLRAGKTQFPGRQAKYQKFLAFLRANQRAKSLRQRT